MSTPDPSTPDPRYPLGRFQWPKSVSYLDRDHYIGLIATLPARLRELLHRVSPAELNIPYREGGWTVRQVVHHLPDSHMNSFIRFKLALTEEQPVVRSYDEGAWARLGDVARTPVEASVTILEGLHERWVALMRSMSDQEWKRTFQHSEAGVISLESNLALYAWHGDHHLAHIKSVIARRSS